MSLIKEQINPNNLPKHVAIIMDGNGRWAKSRGEKRTFGHKVAVESVRNAINAADSINIKFLTLYTFSSENWGRPDDEVDSLMNLLAESLLAEVEEMHRKGLKLHVIGDINKLPDLVKEILFNIVELTSKNTKLNLVLALSYGSHNEILNAVKEISSKVKKGEIVVEAIDEQLFENHLYTKNIPNVDLLIRTSGEMRVSNFLLWQMAYAEMQFLDVLWPDFSENHFFQCILDYQNKERRYGKTSEQISK